MFWITGKLYQVPPLKYLKVVVVPAAGMSQLTCGWPLAFMPTVVGLTGSVATVGALMTMMPVACATGRPENVSTKSNS
jgi:hypothetical protein